jgi:hypothetical protein
MNKIRLLLIISAFGVLATILLTSGNLGGQDSNSINTNKAASDAFLVHVYTNLFCSMVAANVSKYTVALNFIDQGNPQAAKRMLLIWLEGDMQVIDSKTNHSWSEDEKKAITRARAYLKKDPSHHRP